MKESEEKCQKELQEEQGTCHRLEEERKTAEKENSIRFRNAQSKHAENLKLQVQQHEDKIQEEKERYTKLLADLAASKQVGCQFWELLSFFASWFCDSPHFCSLMSFCLSWFRCSCDGFSFCFRYTL